VLYEEILTASLLLFAVLGLFIALRLHYIFAFKLLKKTSEYEVRKEKIEKIKSLLFFVLNILLVFAFIGIFSLDTYYLYEGYSLKNMVIELWDKIPEGFWLELLFKLFRIAVMIAIMKVIFKFTFRFLQKKEEELISKKRYKEELVKLFYLRVKNTIKYTFVLGVMYRITHFFSFLEEVSFVFLVALVGFFMVSFGVSLREYFGMLRSDKWIPLIYTDGKLERLKTHIKTDGHLLIVNVRGEEYRDLGFEYLESDDGNFLNNFKMEFILPLKIVKIDLPNNEAFEKLSCEINMQRGKKLKVNLKLITGFGIFEIINESVFENAFVTLQKKLPKNYMIKSCLSCVYSHYNPYGNGAFGELSCFYSSKEKALDLKNKFDLLDLMDINSTIVNVQETFLCENHRFLKEGEFGYKNWS